MTSSTVVSWGFHVATITRPTPTGDTPRSRSARTNAFGRRFAEELFLARCGAIDDGAVLSDDPVEHLHVRTDREQVLQLAAGHEDEPPTRVTESAERRNRLIIDASVMRNSAVVIACEDVVTHVGPSTFQ